MKRECYELKTLEFNPHDQTLNALGNRNHLHMTMTKLIYIFANII
jgi:hypothetical protein